LCLCGEKFFFIAVVNISFPYVLCFLTRGERVLMLHRRYPPNQGLWNGVGGRIERGETPLAACLREVEEETGFTLSTARFCGLLTWSGFEINDGGLYLFTAGLPSPETDALVSPEQPVPLDFDCPEGELAWQPRRWACTAPEVVSNLHICLPQILDSAPPQEYHFDYSSGQITHYEINKLKD
jgi:8-oxo-dGTP diphosphatase